jgi:hypothetical protein
MRVINGYTVISHRESTFHGWGFVILAVRELNVGPHPYEYVAGIVNDIDDKEWFWGHYTFSLDDAVKNYNER